MFVNLWEFHVKSGMEKMFEKVYGTKGDWAVLFGQAPGYRGSRLIRDVAGGRRYFTLDYWESRDDFEVFGKKHEAAYAELDKWCGSLTESERHLGEIETPGEISHES